MALLLSPLSLSIALLSRRAGRLADRIGRWLPLTIGAFLVGAASAGMALTLTLMLPWTVLLPLVVVKSLGMAAVVSPLSSAVMLAISDADTGLASGLNNAVARAGGLVAVAGLGALAAVVFSVSAGELPGIEFGAEPAAPLGAPAEGLRVLATSRAFQAIAAASGMLCFAAAAVAWATQPAVKSALQ